MTVYEIAALGTPGLVLAQNLREENRMQAFAHHGTVDYLGLGSDVAEATITRAVSDLLADLPRRRMMSEKGRTLVDGMGAARAAELVLGSAHKKETEGARR
jgi:spore coat polysaccharide biosynthesis predicted glycosyltransferase SpsG